MNVNEKNPQKTKTGVVAGGPHSPMPNKDHLDGAAQRLAMKRTTSRDEKLSYIEYACDTLKKGKK